MTKLNQPSAKRSAVRAVEDDEQRTATVEDDEQRTTTVEDDEQRLATTPGRAELQIGELCFRSKSPSQGKKKKEAQRRRDGEIKKK